VSRKLQANNIYENLILSTASRKLTEEENNSVGNEISFEPELLLSRLSFSHFLELITIDDKLKRSFYEVQSIKNNWGARELGRAINTMLYERTGLSTDKEEVLQNFKADTPKIIDIVKNPFFLEFIGLEEKPSYTETDLEQAIINHLQNFLTELGRGFCLRLDKKESVSIINITELIWYFIIEY
jgi:predicted nuclease of restriction endonuclease-like (RecB) superfamily